MKQIITIFFLFIFAWKNLYDIGFTIYWKINQAYIAKTLCENRNRPKLHCDGKCYLSRKLKEAEEKSASKEMPPSKAKEKLDPFTINEIGNIENIFPVVSYTSTQSHNAILSGYVTSFFRPPDSV